MTGSHRLLATGIALLVPALFQLRWIGASQSRPEVRLQQPSLPADVGPWSARTDDVFSADVVAKVGVDAYLLRLYEGPDRVPVWAYVGMYPGFGNFGGKYHSPETCFPAHGWEILDARPVAITLAGSDASQPGTLHAKVMSVQRGNERQDVLYWFQSAKRWPQVRAFEELLRVFDAVMDRPQYAFVRLSSPSTNGPQANQDLVEFAARIAPAIRSAVERRSVGPGERTALRGEVAPWL